MFNNREHFRNYLYHRSAKCIDFENNVGVFFEAFQEKIRNVFDKSAIFRPSDLTRLVRLMCGKVNERTHDNSVEKQNCLFRNILRTCNIPSYIHRTHMVLGIFENICKRSVEQHPPEVLTIMRLDNFSSCF